jgi:transglutaminase-like putative cysteine protease
MRLWTYTAVVLLAVPPVAVAQPAYMIEVRPAKKIEAVLSLDVNTPNLKASEWVLVVPRLPELPGQTKVKSTMNYPADEVEDLSPEKRPLLRARVKVKDKDLESKISIVATYEAELFSRKLVPVPAGAKPPKVAPLTEAERALYLQSTGKIDFDCESFKAFLRDYDLVRKKDESDLEYGKRLFLFVGRKFGYEYTAKMDRAATAVCRLGRSDCGGLSILMVSALRGHGIPARLRIGRWASSSKEGEKIGDVGWTQTHSWLEFYCEGIGWVPADPSGLVVVDRSPGGLEYFGYDRGNFVTLHVDHDMVLDTVFWGKHYEPFLQMGAYWAVGSGSTDGSRNEDRWTVKEVK